MRLHHKLAERARHGCTGFTLVEFALAMAGLALVGGAMVSLFVGTTRVDQVQAADDRAQQAVRDARALLAKDVREARRFVAAGAASFTVWVDDEWDGVMPDGELVTWTIGSAGTLSRAVGAAAAKVEAWGLRPAESLLAYDSRFPADVTRAFLHLAIGVTGPEGGVRTLDFEVSLRNVP